MTIRPLQEQQHTGYALLGDEGVVVVNAPLDTDAVMASLPDTPVAVIETGIPHHRIGGGRPLAAATGAPLYAPPGVTGGEPPAGLGMSTVAVAGASGDDFIVVVPGAAFIGDLDSVPWVPDAAAADRVTAARRKIAAGYTSVSLLGSRGRLTAAQLLDTPRPASGTAPLNCEAILLTNSGLADMFWADPRNAADAPATSLPEALLRLDSPWGPVILDLGTGMNPIPAARRLEPARVASELTGLTTERQVVVVADDDETARRAAGFLAGLGLSAAWASRESRS
ncbi:MAG: hypothetical protein ACE5E8_04190 [Acidimicrobiia bacterium]